jgi:hypothetical protein
MIPFLIFSRLTLFLTAFQLSASIAPLKDAKHLSQEERFEYSVYIVEAAQQHKLDPYLVAAVIWHESRFQKDVKSRTQDYGLLQVHWQKLHPQLGEDWLVGLTRESLLDPRTNIFAGTRELAHNRHLCRRRRHDPGDHPWWAHHKWGNVVGNPAYGLAIQKRHATLIRNRGRISKPHRSRGPKPTS